VIRLSAFADEISPDLQEQIEVLKSEGISFLDLRGVWHTNVLNLTDQQLRDVKQALDAHGITVATLGSPIGKVAISRPFAETLHQLERAIAIAQLLGTRYIRIFSFYPPDIVVGDQGGEGIVNYRDEVLARLQKMTAQARAVGVVLLHENEKNIYGDTIVRCVDLLTSIDDLHFCAVFDPANFIQCGEIPFPDAYEALRPWLSVLHVKDAQPDGSVVAAGEGITRWPDLLRQLQADGYDGFFSLEPHLASVGQFQGFSGPELFHYASQAFQALLQSMHWDYC
jgi:3-dehydroshikimate dehydratase